MVLIDFSYLLYDENMDRASLAETAGATKTITFPPFLGSERVGLNKQSSNTSLGAAKICTDTTRGQHLRGLGGLLERAGSFLG